MINYLTWAAITVAGLCFCIISNTVSSIVQSWLTYCSVPFLCATPTGHRTGFPCTPCSPGTVNWLGESYKVGAISLQFDYHHTHKYLGNHLYYNLDIHFHWDKSHLRCHHMSPHKKVHPEHLGPHEHSYFQPWSYHRQQVCLLSHNFQWLRSLYSFHMQGHHLVPPV